MVKAFFKELVKISKEHKSTFWVHVFLRIPVLFLFVFSLVRLEFGTAVFCLFTLLLFWLPFLLEHLLKLTLPATLQITVLLFIFCSEVLGEIACFYLRIPLWDTILHTLNGFLCAAIGFSLIDILNRNNRFRGTLSPAFVVLVAFCFSMTVGVFWEFFEFSMDAIFHFDMQKDTILTSVYSVLFDESRQNISIGINGIAKTVLYGKDGEVLQVINGGYLDLGIYDTMKDLIVNFFGAVIFCFIGYFYLKNRGKGKFAKRFIPTLKK